MEVLHQPFQIPLKYDLIYKMSIIRNSSRTQRATSSVSPPTVPQTSVFSHALFSITKPPPWAPRTLTLSLRGGTHTRAGPLVPQTELSAQVLWWFPAEASRTARLSWPKCNRNFIGFVHKELDTLRWNAQELTVALSRTFTESSSATLCFRSASSSVQRGRFSHFPNTTRSMSLDTEHTAKVFEEARNGPCFVSTQICADTHQTSETSTHLSPAPDNRDRLCWRGLLCRGQEEVGDFNDLLLTVTARKSGLRKRSKTSKNTSERSLFIPVSGTKTLSMLMRYCYLDHSV